MRTQACESRSHPRILNTLRPGHHMTQNPSLSTTISLDGTQDITIEANRFAPQAAGSALVRSGDTVVFAAVVSGKPKADVDFFPLTVEYREKHYAGGIISSSRFIKRESRPSDNEILTARLIDRSIRPLFPKGFYDDVQVIVSPLSIDQESEPEILSIIAASAALSFSSLPWEGPIGAVRVGMDDKGHFLINPTNTQKTNSKLDLVVSGAQGSIAMVEAGAHEVSESTVLEALDHGQKNIDLIIKAISDLATKLGKSKLQVEPEKFDATLVKLVEDKLDVNQILSDSKTNGGEGINISNLVDQLINDDQEIDRIQVAKLIDDRIRNAIRSQLLDKNTRFDGRAIDEIRQLSSEVSLLPRTHGSALFMRGLTHVLSTVTLASPGSEQLIEGMKGEQTKRYMHHYNMPPYATGEPGRIGGPNRREIGHGALAERALEPVLPSQDQFSYTIRVVSEVLSGNGSTSQASVCGSTLALMDAGVPIKKPVAGIAMGLITDGKKYITLTDIAGLEDHFGDMDFKVAGTVDGITAIQMDVKVTGVSAQVLKDALEQARVGRLAILENMKKTIDQPRSQLSPFAPRVVTLQIDPTKIGVVIGPGGKTIRPIQEDLDVEINIEDDGLVSITGTNHENVNKAKKLIEDLTAEVEVGKIYSGKVQRIQPFGAFVEILPGKDGLVHVSNMGKEFVSDPHQLVKEGDQVQVKVFEIDSQGRVNLTMNLDDNPASRDRTTSPRRESRQDQSSRPSQTRSSRPRTSNKPGATRNESRFSRFNDKR